MRKGKEESDERSINIKRFIDQNHWSLTFEI
jgi:hypothetical protein